jgi:anti-sigma factor RsiW
MSHPTREDLLGYLLGALERTEHEQVERHLAEHPELHEELAALQRWVDAIGLAEEPAELEPPKGLAERACQIVSLSASSDVTVQTRSQHRASMLEVRRHFSLADVLVAAAVMVAAVTLFFPALASSRFQANVAACQNRLRHLGSAAQAYADFQPDRSFPAVQLVGNRAAAGVYAPTLASGQFVDDPRLFVCPSSELADNLDGWEVPSLEALDKATGPTLDKYRKTMGGSYGYNLGYLKDGELKPPANEHRSHFALLADAPSDDQPNRRTANHEGRGQNVLYEDGHVAFLTTLPLPRSADDPFHNRHGAVAAGVDRDDAVLGRSADPPMPMDWVAEPRR